MIKQLRELREYGHQTYDRWPWGTHYEDESSFWNPNGFEVGQQAKWLQEGAEQLADEIIRLHHLEQGRDWQCEFSCGFEDDDYEVVRVHEETCTNNQTTPDIAMTYQTRPQSTPDATMTYPTRLQNSKMG